MSPAATIRAVESDGALVMRTLPYVAAVGAGVLAGSGFLGVAALGTAVVAVLTAVSASAKGLRRVAGLLIAASFVTRFELDVLGLGLRPEHVFVAIGVGALLLIPRRAVPSSLGESRGVLVFVALYIGWLALISQILAPDPGASFRIVGWLALDLLVVAILVLAYSSVDQLVAVGMRAAIVAFAIADALWVVALLGGGDLGVQTETLTGAPAAYGLMHEANILGGAAAIWLFIALTNRAPAQRRVAAYLVPVATLALLASLTRAAIIGLLLGLAIWGVVEGRWARRGLLRVAAITIATLGFVRVLFPALADAILTKLQALTEIDEGTGATRVSSLATALGDLGDWNWIHGLGANSFGQRHFEPTRPGEQIPAYLPSLPLEVLYSGGVIGVAILGAAMVAARPWRLVRSGRAWGVFAIYMVSAASTSPFWFASTWVLVAAAILARDRAIEQPGDERRPSAPTEPLRGPSAASRGPGRLPPGTARAGPAPDVPGPHPGNGPVTARTASRPGSSHRSPARRNAASPPHPPRGTSRRGTVLMSLFGVIVLRFVRRRAADRG